MSGAAIHVEQDRVRPIERRGITGPAVEIGAGLNAGHPIQALLQQRDPGVELVRQRSVAGSARDQRNSPGFF